MKNRRSYRKPELCTFPADVLREEAAMAFLQAGSPTPGPTPTECCAPRLPSDECPSTLLDVPEGT